MPLPILYSFRRCPYAMRARIALLASGTQVEIREVVLRRKPAAMLAASAKGTVPVLVLPGGAVIDESIEIMRWALDRNDPEGWRAGDDAALIAANDGPFKHHLDRYKYAGRYDADPLLHRAAAAEMLEEMDQRLAPSGYFCGARRTLADIALFPFVRQFAEVDRSWFDGLPLPAVRHWLATLTNSQLFASVMLRLPCWSEADPPTYFPAETIR